MERLPFRHGFSDAAWESAKSEARAILYDTAKSGGLISYSELVERITAVHLEAHDTRLDHFLGQIAGEDDEAGKGLTTVLVVHKSGDQMPGPGFFDMAEGRGRDVSDPVAFWMQELKAVHEYWK
ncbi:MAG: hypothetical protein AAFP79_13885 [Pseudomonadota bacterium]